MNKITLYIGKTILVAILLVMTLLVGLEFIFSLVNEVRYIGTGDYTTWQALCYILWSVPGSLSQMFPMSALVGTLLGLGLLASRSELIAMRAAGLSMGDIAVAVLKMALFLAVFTWILAEGLAPTLNKLASTQKAISLSQGQALRTADGTWMRDGDSFVHIQTINAGKQLEGITRYEFNPEGVLQKASFARFADYEKGKWILHDIQETFFQEEHIARQQMDKQIWRSHIDPDILSIVGVKDIDDLSLFELWQTIHYRTTNQLDAKPYQLAFWQKMVQPLATLVMMFLAIPFIFGPLRSATMGFRMLVGVLLGFAFYTFNQLFGPITLVYHLPPIVGALLPTCLFLGIGLCLFRKA